MYLNIGKNYGTENLWFSEDDIKTGADCINKALKFHCKAKDIRYAVLQNEINNASGLLDVERIRDYAQSCETIASDYYYLKDYEKSVKTRKDLLNEELIQKYKDMEPLKKVIHNVFLNIAGTIKKAYEDSLKGLKKNDIEYCVNILKMCIDYYDNESELYERARERLSWFEELKAVE